MVNDRFTALEAEVTAEENGNDGIDAELNEIKQQIKANVIEIRALNVSVVDSMSD